MTTFETIEITNNAPDSAATVSRDGKKVAFSEEGSIYLYDTETKELAELVRKDAEYSYGKPVISQDFEKVLVLTTRSCGSQKSRNEGATGAAVPLSPGPVPPA